MSTQDSLDPTLPMDSSDTVKVFHPAIETRIDNNITYSMLLNNVRVTQIKQIECSLEKKPHSRVGDNKLAAHEDEHEQHRREPVKIKAYSKEGLPLPVSTKIDTSSRTARLLSCIRSLTPLSVFLLAISLLLLGDAGRRMHTIHRMNDALSEQIRAYETMSNN